MIERQAAAWWKSQGPVAPAAEWHEQAEAEEPRQRAATVWREVAV